MLVLLVVLLLKEIQCYHRHVVSIIINQHKQHHLTLQAIASNRFTTIPSDRYLVNNADTIIALPLTTITMSEIALFKKDMPAHWIASVIKTDKLIELVDATGFCMFAEYLTGIHLYVFILKDYQEENNSNPPMEYLSSWIRKISKNQLISHQFLIAKKGHILRAESLDFIKFKEDNFYNIDEHM